MNKRSLRRQLILETLALELEARPLDKLSTARLAASVGVSEAALYRHFASKAQMYEALIEYAEETVFPRFNQILAQQRGLEAVVRDMCAVVIGFAERNPGIARVLGGDILLGEDLRLRARTAKFFQRIETQIKQVMREARASAAYGANVRDPVVDAAIVVKHLVGSLELYIRSGFQRQPRAEFEQEWEVLRGVLLN